MGQTSLDEAEDFPSAISADRVTPHGEQLYDGRVHSHFAGPRRRHDSG